MDEVVGFDTDSAALETALRHGVITEAASTAAEAAAYADLVVVSTPVRSIPALVEECAGAEPRPRLISDMGSTKSAIIARSVAAGPLALHRRSSHLRCCRFRRPYARADLFEGATYFLCTTGAAFPKLYEMLQQFILDLGARPTHIDAVAHDRIMAVVSHLPHVVANILMEHAGEFKVGGKRALHCVGSSFKDLTRVAGANPPMWRDIFLENREALAESLSPSCGESWTVFSAYLEAGDESGIAEAIQKAATFREELLEYEDITPQTLYKVTVRIPDQPGSFPG